jgi:hypothetical protein
MIVTEIFSHPNLVLRPRNRLDAADPGRSGFYRIAEHAA